MIKLIIVALAVVAVLYTLPQFFPFLLKVAFVVAGFSITWGLILLGAVIFFGLGLKSGK